MIKKKTATIICLITALLLVIGCFHLPIGYYTFLRIVVFVASIVIIIDSHKMGFNYCNITTGIVGILFNPIIPVYLHSKMLWTVIDIIASVWFIIVLFIVTHKPTTIIRNTNLNAPNGM